MIFFLNISHSLTPQYHHILYIIRRTRRRNHTNLSLLNQWKRSTKKLRLSRWEAKQLDSFVALRHTKDERKKRKSFRFVSCWAAHHLQTKIELDDLFSAAAWQISNTLILCVSSLVWTSATSISSASHHHYPLAEHPAAQKLITQPHFIWSFIFLIDGYFIDWALVSDDDETQDRKQTNKSPFRNQATRKKRSKNAKKKKKRRGRIGGRSQV